MGAVSRRAKSIVNTILDAAYRNEVGIENNNHISRNQPPKLHHRICCNLAMKSSLLLMVRYGVMRQDNERRNTFRPAAGECAS